jgi:hypothetical protein
VTTIEEAILHFIASVSGNVLSPANALGPPDDVWTTNTDNSSWTHRWRLDGVSEALGAVGTQTLTLRLRKAGATANGNPTVDSVTLIQGGATHVIRSTAFSVTSLTGQDLVITFSGTLLDGLENVDIEIATTAAGGGPANRAAVQIDAATWEAVYEVEMYVDALPLAGYGPMGNPWHGPVQDGVLTLPNEETLPHTQPWGVTALPHLSGRAWKVQGPGAHIPQRTPEEQAADEARGMQWFDGALISGNAGHFYGKSLYHSGTNGWFIYLAPDGSLWRAGLHGSTGGGPYDSSTARQYRVDFVRMNGRFRYGDPDPAEDPITVLSAPFSNWGQDTGPEIPDVTSWYELVEDVFLNGSKVILSLSPGSWITFPEPPATIKNHQYSQLWNRPIGFIQVTISGTPGVDAAVTVELLRNRAQTVGVVNYGSFPPASCWQYLQVDFDYQIVHYEPKTECQYYDGFEYRVKATPIVGIWQTMPAPTTSFPARDGYTSGGSGPDLPDSRPPDPTGEAVDGKALMVPVAGGWTAFIGEHTMSTTMDLLVGMYYDVAGNPQEVWQKVRHDVTWAGQADVTADGVHEAIYNKYHTSACTIENEILSHVTAACSFQTTLHAKVSVAFEFGGAGYEYAHAELHWERSGTGTFSTPPSFPGSYGPYAIGKSPATQHGVQQGWGKNPFGAVANRHDDALGLFTSTVNGYFVCPNLVPGDRLWAAQATMTIGSAWESQIIALHSGWPNGGTSEESTAWSADVGTAKWTCGMYGPLLRYVNASYYGDLNPRWVYPGAACKMGFDPTIVDAGQTQSLYGSYSPLSGDMLWAKTSRICFV